MVAFDHALMTPRLRLEPVTAQIAALANSDVDELARVLNADLPEDWRRAGLPLVRQKQPPNRDWRPMRCVAVLRETNTVVGDIRFERRADSPGETYEIGYAIIPAYRRGGLAVEATACIIDWLFSQAGAELIIGGCDRRNQASIKTLRKLGFWLDGSRGSAFWWRLTPDLWEEARPATARA